MTDAIVVPETEKWALSAKNDFTKATNETTWIREITFAMQILKAKASSFQNCNKQSIRDAVMNIALTGVTLDPVLDQAYLIPRTLKGRGLCCCLDIGYKGLVKIAVDSGSVLDIDATCVYEGDDFYYEMGLKPTLNHIPKGEKTDDKILHVYSKAIIEHPNPHKEDIIKFLVLDKNEIDKVRATSKAQNGPWGDWYGEMAKKTAVKRIYKLLPQTERVSKAISVLNEHEGLIETNPQDKGKELAGRFGGELPSGKVEELPVEDSLLERLDKIETIEELDKFWPAFESKLENFPEEKDTLVEAFEYKRSELKEAK